MSKINLDEREFELINILGPKLSSNQRDLSRHMDLSLGMTNMLIRRLISKGFIRIRQLNKKKVEYILTPKGFAEKMRKSMKYTMKTIRSVGLINERLREIISDLYGDGHRIFYLLGASDLVFLVETLFHQESIWKCKVKRIESVPQDLGQGVLLICKENVSDFNLNGILNVNLIKELAKSEELVSSKLE